jgi:hypothetical protein
MCSAARSPRCSPLPWRSLAPPGQHSVPGVAACSLGGLQPIVVNATNSRWAIVKLVTDIRDCRQGRRGWIRRTAAMNRNGIEPGWEANLIKPEAVCAA